MLYKDKHIYQPYKCVQSAVYATEHSQKQLFLGYALALFQVKIQVKIWDGDRILIRFFAVVFRSTPYVINVHASEYFMCEILIFLVNISGFET